MWNLYHWSNTYDITHWGRVTHICVGNLTIIGPDKGLSPGRRQAIIWTNAGILLIGPWEQTSVKFYRYSNIFIQENAFKNVVCEMAPISSRPQCDNPERCWQFRPVHIFEILLKTLPTYYSAHSMSSYRTNWQWIDREGTYWCCQSCSPFPGCNSTRGWSHYWVETVRWGIRTAYATGNPSFITVS